MFQFGNTCYSNSVLQALYFCRPFREKVLEYKARNKRTKETLLTCLADLFYNIATQKKKVRTDRQLSLTGAECGPSLILCDKYIPTFPISSG